MKLISCYIENFGCISNKEYFFNENLTVILQENGFGKSTLVAFIKAMFYGLDSYKINSIGFSDRLHYCPFSGGQFGGNLTFNHNGKEYKIERFFADKSETGDTLKVYHNGVETNELGLEVGKTIFGLDKQSFERVITVSSDEIEIKSTSSINSKLSEFLEGNIDDVSIDDAMDILVATQKHYKKSKQGKSEISKEQELILELTSKIANVKSISLSLEQKNQELTCKEQKVKELSQKIVESQKLNEQLASYEHYERLLSFVNASALKIEEINLKYKNGIPTLEETEKISELLIKNRELNASQINSVTNEELAFYNEKSTIFSKGVPSSEQFSEVLSDINALSKLDAERKSIEESSYTPKEKSIIDNFSRAPLTKEKIMENDALVEEFKRKTQEYQTMGDFLSKIETKKTPTAYKVIAVLLGLVGVAGIALLFINVIIGACLLGVSVLSLLAIGFIYLNKKSAPVQTENAEKVKLKVELSSLEDKIKNTLAFYGYLTGGGVIYDFVEFRNDYQTYLTVLEKKNLERENLKVIKSEIEIITSKLLAFFSYYNVVQGNFFERFSILKENVSKYLNIKSRLDSATKNQGAINQAISNNNLIINAFYQKYGVSNLDEIKADINALNSERENLTRYESSASDYKKQKNLTEKPQGESVDLTYLNDALIKLQDEVAMLKRSIDADESEVERLDGYEIDKRSAEERLATYKKKYNLLVATEEFLSLAEQNLKDKYVKPVKDEFITYASLLEKVLGEKVIMTKDFEINFERNGKPRSDKHLSSGQKSVCALCFRLALIKNMYKNVLPFIVLDDPFVHLDNNHLQKVKTLIEGLSKDMQILYFTCHESRDLS
ncbi:MAG: hypothetical protein E7358_04545 [Clostridiales bacterium]|nr:hypothetical protein [Clostridiales bacterium]